MGTPETAGERSAPGRDRILRAAIDRFAQHGFAGASLKVIAQDAGVSQALIVHHFGSKDALREACDELIVSRISERIREETAKGREFDLLAAMRERQELQRPWLPYLARALSEGAPSAARLVDEFAKETLRANELGVANGQYRPTEYARERTLVLMIWSLGTLVLHDHVRRLLGVDLAGPPEQLLPYLRGAMEIVGDSVMTEERRDRGYEAIARLEDEQE